MALVGLRKFNFSKRILNEFTAKNKKSINITPVLRSKHTAFITNKYQITFNNAKWRSTNFVRFTSITTVRWSSQGVEAKPPIFIDEASLPPIPSPLTSIADIPSDAVTEIIGTIAKEPSLQSYGLGNWTPVGLIQNSLEYFHIGLDLPWWGSIVLGTLILRIMVFPIVVISQRSSARMSNNMPQLQKLQLKMTEARQSGNNFEAARMGQEMMMFMKEKQLNPIKNMLPPLAQAPLFISMFMGLRSMTNVPVESMRDGGALWFTDLTMPDQYYLLPIITSLTLAATVEVGTDAARASTMGMVRYVLRAIPIIIFPFTMNFPGAVLCYWVSTNFISLIQVSILRIPKVRKYFNIEPIVYHAPDALPGKKKGFVKGMKESLSNMKITRQMEDRERVDSMNFQKAGRAPIQRTFKYDPTKVQSSTHELLAKKKE